LTELFKIIKRVRFLRHGVHPQAIDSSSDTRANSSKIARIIEPKTHEAYTHAPTEVWRAKPRRQNGIGITQLIATAKNHRR